MRMSLQFAIFIGLLPTVIFVVTLWLTDGAPLRPVGVVTVPEAGQQDPGNDGDRLRRLAGDGNPDAAILLTILDDSRIDPAGKRH